MTNVKKFFEEAIKSEQAKQLFASMEKPNSEQETLACYVQIAVKLGYTLSAEEISAYLTAQKPCTEVDEEELAQVAGGAGDKVEKEDCVSTFRHRENCWYNDACDLLVTPYKTYECHYTSR